MTRRSMNFGRSLDFHQDRIGRVERLGLGGEPNIDGNEERHDGGTRVRSLGLSKVCREVVKADRSQGPRRGIYARRLVHLGKAEPISMRPCLP